MGARLGFALLSNIELVMASESASCGARNCFLKLRLSSPYRATWSQKRCLLGLQRAPSEPEWTLREEAPRTKFPGTIQDWLPRSLSVPRS